MITLDQALTDHAKRAAQYEPDMWAGHYNSCQCDPGCTEGVLLGEMSQRLVAPMREVQTMVSLLLPWSLTKAVTDSFLTLTFRDEIWVLRLAATRDGFWQSMWIVPMDGPPRLDQWPQVQTSIYQLADGLFEARRDASAGVSYDEAALAAAQVYGQ